MVHFTLKFALAGIALAATIGTTGIPRNAQAHAQGTNLRHAAAPQCTETIAHLNGMNQPTVAAPVDIACSGVFRPSQVAGASPTVSPSIATNCDPSTSEYFFSDIGYSGSLLCLTSTGYVDLHVIPFGFNDNWANKISSYSNAYTYAGRGYESSTGTYGAYVPVPFGEQMGDLRSAVINGVNYGNWNDRIQEVCVDGPGVPNCAPR